MPVVALIVAALGALQFCPVPKPILTIWQLLWTVSWYLPLPWIMSVAVMALAGRRNVNWRLAATTLWFGPLAVLFRIAPEWTPVPVALWTIQLFLVLMTAPPRNHRGLSVAVAVSIQAVVLLAALGYSGWAALVIIFPAAILAWGFAPVTARWMRPAVVLVILLLVLIPMSNYLVQPSSGSGSYDRRREAPDTEGKKAEAGSPQDVHRGVILWPPKPKEMKLVAPPPPRIKQQMLTARVAPTLRIPFSGVYWFFQLPFSQPPPNSFTEYGVPTEKSYRATGGLPMQMEAHQHLGTMVELTCCRAIQVEVTNADPLGHETLLELILWDTTRGGKPHMSLGLLPAAATPNLGVTSLSTITFPIPADRRIQRFDAISVRFQRPPFRRLRSTHMAVEGFVLVPAI